MLPGRADTGREGALRANDSSGGIVNYLYAATQCIFCMPEQQLSQTWIFAASYVEHIFTGVKAGAGVTAQKHTDAQKLAHKYMYIYMHDAQNP